MSFLLENGIFTTLSEDIISEARDFSCGHPDLDDFFHKTRLMFYDLIRIIE